MAQHSRSDKPVEQRQSLWVNVYKTGFGSLCFTREEVDKLAAGEDREGVLELKPFNLSILGRG